MLVWIVRNVWWKPLLTHAISVILALVASVNSVNSSQTSRTRTGLSLLYGALHNYALDHSAYSL